MYLCMYILYISAITGTREQMGTGLAQEQQHAKVGTTANSDFLESAANSLTESSSALSLRKQSWSLG